MNLLRSLHAARSLRLLLATILTIVGVFGESTTRTRRLGSLTSQAPVAQPREILINAGAVADFTERNSGRVWMKDQYFIGGGVLSKQNIDIIGSSNDEIFQAERGGEFRYEIPAAPGTYQLQLHFAELYLESTGERLFDVTIEDSIPIKKFDIYKSALGSNRVVTLNYTLPVTDGFLSLDFKNSIPKMAQPQLSGIEVKFLSTSTKPVNPFPILINCGSGEVVEKVGATTRTWMADQYFVSAGGATHDDTSNPRTQAISNIMYRTIRWGLFRYEVPVPIGSYDVTLHFCQYGWPSGYRLFDVAIEDVVLNRNVDVAKLANGNNKPLAMKYQVNVTDGLLSVFLPYSTPARDAPMISGIEINTMQNSTMNASTSFPIRGSVLAPMNINPAALKRLDPFILRINAGSATDYIDAEGTIWESDTKFINVGQIYSGCPLKIMPFINTTLDSLYCTERYFNKMLFVNKTFKYDIPVPRVGSTYSVKLHFAEINYYFWTKERVFDVYLNGEIALKELDIYSEVGYATALIIPLTTRVTSATSQISIEFVSKIENSKICAIEIIEIDPPIAPIDTLMINAGAVGDFTDRNTGKIWMKDQYFIGGGVMFKPNEIIGSNNDEIFHVERGGEFRYEIPAAPGTYQLQLHFAELYLKSTGERLFDVTIEDSIRVKNFDIVKSALGSYRAVTLAYTLPITDGFLSLDFRDSIPKVNQPQLSSIELKFLSTSTKPINPFPILINCGGGEYVEKVGATARTWMADKYFVFGNVNGTADAVANRMYATCRWGLFRYEVPVPIGSYDVTLYFVEPGCPIGNRIFDVTIEDVVLNRNVDVAKIANGINKPITLRYQVNVTDGLLSVYLPYAATAKEAPMISGIEINQIQNGLITVPTSTPIIAPVLLPTINPFPILINCGGGKYIETVGAKTRTWMTDRDFVSGSIMDVNSDPRSQAIANKMYHTCRYGSFRYEVPIPIGSYEVTLHFEEPTYQAGVRFFDVVIEDAFLYRNVDVAKIGNGPFKPVKLISQVNVTDGLLSIVLPTTNPAKGDPMISGIEINQI